MKTKKWFAVLTIVAFTAVPGLASAHMMDRDGGQHLEKCVSHICKGKEARLCSKTLSRTFMEDRVDFKRMNALHMKLKEVMGARTFNKKRFLGLMDEMASMHSAMMRRHAAVFASIAARLEPKERKELMRNFFHAEMKMMHHMMMHHHSVKQEQNWFSHLNK